MSHHLTWENPENEEVLKTLARAIALSQGDFSLCLVRCNYLQQREKMVARLQELCPLPLRQLVLDKSIKTLFSTIQQELGEEQPNALIVLGLEAVDYLDGVLNSANQVREEFSKSFAFPLLLWITDEVQRKFIRIVPDIESWATTHRLGFSPEEVIQLIAENVQRVVERLVEVGAGIFVENAALDLAAGSPRRLELEAARQEVQTAGIELEPELQAGLEFILTRDIDYYGEKSRQCYERGLELLQKTANSQRSESVNAQLLAGCLLYHLGLWWRRYGVEHRAEYDQACDRAQSYFQQCVDLFVNAQQPDLAARFINALGDVLQRRQKWTELAKVAETALAWHQTYPHQFRLARAYGFLAEVAISESDWDRGWELATTAGELLESAAKQVAPEDKPTVDWERSTHGSWYLLSQARSLAGKGEYKSAIAKLETAIQQSKPQYDPMLYILILEEMRSLYFQAKEFLAAFQTKQLQRSIEQQFGFRAFIGAGRVQAKQHVSNLALTPGSMASEIAASGREQDVNRLIARIERADHRLTIIHGQSGVGKSSILQAGLIPALRQITLDARQLVPVLQQVYPDWVQELGKSLMAMVEEVKPGAWLGNEGKAIAPILEQLRKNNTAYLLTVLIFDQFEEFFFIYKEPQQRRHFYEFLKQCMDIPHVKVILSLREDYLHYLLECNNRLINLGVINNNILDKGILYYLGNFSPEDAKQVIQNLTRQSQFNLEPSLLDELVRDLAGELGEVRPIELQVVGAQLQTEKIVTLKQYQERGPKNAIVGRFLDEVVQDCGTDNEQIAKLILYLLTDENNTRPLKTRADLEMELEVQSERLDLVLEILVTSRLVFRIPAFPEDRYQLVHDYLVSFVRQQQSSQLIAELEKEREQRKLTEARLTQVLKRELQTARKATLTLGGLLLAIGGFALVATAVGINMYLTNLTLSSAEKTQLDRLMLAIKAGKRFNSLSIAALPETKLRVVAELNKAVYEAKEVNRLEGHKSSITRVAFSLNNQMIASASEDGNIKIWNINGTLIQDFEGHKSSITSLVFSPDSKTLASASQDKTVKLWSIDGKLLKTLKDHQNTVTSIVFSPNGKILASASKDQTVKLWSIDYGKLMRTLKHEDEVTCLSFGADNQMLVSASKDGLIKLWRVDGTQLKSINNYGTVNLVLNSKNKTIISANKNATLKVYSLDGDLLKSGFIHINTVPFNILNTNFSFNSEIIVFNNFGGSNFNVKIQNTKSDETMEMEIVSQEERINTVVINPNNQLVATAGEDKIVKIWNITSLSSNLNQTTNNQSKLIFDKNNDIVTASEDRTVKLWNASGNLVKITHKYESTPQLISNLSIIGTVGVEKTLSSLIDIEGTKLRFSNNHVKALKIDFSPSNQIFTTINNNNTIDIWHREGKLFKKINVYVDSAEKIFFAPDSRMIIVVCKEQLQLRNIKGELITSLKEPSNSIDNIIFSPDSKTFLSINKNKLAKIWSINGRLLGSLKRDIENENNIAFLPNGKFITCTGNKQLVQFHGGKDNSSQDLIGNLIELWNNDGKLIKKLDGHIDGIKAITVSPDSNFLASTSSDNLIILWSVNDNTVRTLKGHTEQIDSISFSPDSKIIASVSTGERRFFTEESGGQSEIKLWQINGELIDTIYDYGINNEIKIKFDLKNNIIIYVNNTKVINIRDLNNKSNILIKGHEEPIKNIDFIPGTNLIISAGNDNTIKIWDLKGKELGGFRASNNEELETKSYHNSIEVYSNFAFRFIASINTYYFKGKQRSKLNIWDINGSKLQDIEADEIHFNDDDSFITAIDRDTKSKKYTVKFWNGDTRKLENFYFEDANSFELSHDNKILALFADKKYSMKLQDMDGNLVSLLKDHKDNINSIAFSPNGEIIASASDDKTIKLWTKEGHLIKTIDKQGAKINSVAFSPDGETIASASDDKTIKLWTKKGDFIKKVGKHNDKVTGVSFSPDGRIIVSVSADGNVKLWDNNGKLWDNNSQPIKNIEDGVKEISDLSFSPDSQLLAMVKNSTIKIYILHGIWFKELQLINDYQSPTLSGLSFSPDGKTIASALEDYNKILVLNFDLNELLIHGCRKVRDYLQNNPNVKDRHLCDDVPKELPPAKEK